MERVTKNRILEDVLWQERDSTGPLEQLGAFGENFWKLAAVYLHWLLQVHGFRSRSSCSFESNVNWSDSIVDEASIAEIRKHFSAAVERTTARPPPERDRKSRNEKKPS